MMKSKWSPVVVISLLAGLGVYGSDVARVPSNTASAAFVISLSLAERMIAGCAEHAAAQKMPPLSIAVIDATGTLIAFSRQDGASPVTGDIALVKARTALRARAPTSALGTYAAHDAGTRDALIALQLTGIPGGLPFSPTEDLVIGAVGVSGGMSQQDEGCAQQAISTGLKALRGNNK